MRRVTRAELLALPAGVLYRERLPSASFGGLCMKAETWANDWLYRDLEVPVDCEDSTERWDLLEGGRRFALDFDGCSRDGAFEDGAEYFVYEASDLEGFLGVLCRAVPA